jgi:hypothetical protein
MGYQLFNHHAVFDLMKSIGRATWPPGSKQRAKKSLFTIIFYRLASDRWIGKDGRNGEKRIGFYMVETGDKKALPINRRALSAYKGLYGGMNDHTVRPGWI